MPLAQPLSRLPHLGTLVLVQVSLLGLPSPLAAEPADRPSPKPVPTFQTVPLPHDEVSFQRDGVELTRYHFRAGLNRPFLYPIVGPSGRSLTRMGHPHDPESHSHHNSVWISHHDVNGVRFWDDRGGGIIRHRRILRFEDGADECWMESVNDWTATNQVLLVEHRRITVRGLPDNPGGWLLILDVSLAPGGSGPVTLGQTPFGLLGVRMAKTIGVHDGGGTIRNSEGAINEEQVFWKPARWVDYAGPITPGRSEGITLLDHPSNRHHPSVFHVRNDGWMGASLTFDQPLTLRPGETLTLRYGLHVHEDLGEPTRIEAVWDLFRKLPLPTENSP